MNEELSPLEALHKIANAEMKEQYKATKDGFVYRVVSDEYSKELKIIETALKRLENYEQNEDFNKDVLNYAFLNEQDKIKKLKTLEIIKSFANYQVVEVQGQWYLMQGVSFDKSLKFPITEEQAILLQEVLL